MSRYIIAGYTGDAIAVVPFGHEWTQDKLEALCRLLVPETLALIRLTHPVCEIYVPTPHFHTWHIPLIHYCYWAGRLLDEAGLKALDDLLRMPRSEPFNWLWSATEGILLPKDLSDHVFSMYERHGFSWPWLMPHWHYEQRLVKAALQALGQEAPDGFWDYFAVRQKLVQLDPCHPATRLAWEIVRSRGEVVPRLLVEGRWDVWDICRRAFLCPVARLQGKGMIRLENGTLVGETIQEVPQCDSFDARKQQARRHCVM